MIAAGRAISTFSGMGGGALAAARSGYNVKCFDFDPDAHATLIANGQSAVCADIKDVNWSPYSGADLLIGGPPCQSFSAAGLQSGESDPRNAIPAFIDAVRALRPRVFIMENVKGLTWQKHRDFLVAVLEQFRELGYTVDHRILNAADFGVPQTRQRVFVVGRLDGPVVWPLATHSEKGSDYIDPWVPLAFALDRDLPEPWDTRPATTVVGSFGADVIAGPGYRTKGDPSRQNAAGSVKVSHEERKIIQGFPSRWKLKGSKTSIDRQLGNACPPALLQAVITAQVSFIPVRAFTFKAALDRAFDNERIRAMLTPYTLEELEERRCFLSPDMLTGFVISEEGDFGGLFNIGPAGRGVAAVAAGVRQGAKTLDCFDPYLPWWYARQGWVEDHREANWTEGGPDVVFMRYEP